MQSADEKQWHDFVLGDLATIHSGHDIYAQERFSGNTPYVTACLLYTSDAADEL